MRVFRLYHSEASPTTSRVKKASASRSRTTPHPKGAKARTGKKPPHKTKSQATKAKSDNPPFEHNFNAKLLLEQLESKYDDDVQIVEPERVDKGKKRARSPSQDSDIEFTDRKRVKLERNKISQRFRAAQYIIDLEYNWEGDHDTLATVSSVEDLVQAQGRKAYGGTERTLLVSPVHVCKLDGRAAVCLGSNTSRHNSCAINPERSRLLTIPNDGGDAQTVHDTLVDCLYIIDKEDRAAVTPVLQIVSSSSDSSGTSSLHLRLTVDVDLIFPAVTYWPQGCSVSVAHRIWDTQCRIISRVFPREPTPPPASYNGRLDIPFLYSLLSRAPVPTSIPTSILQPHDLQPTLLPFQRNSLHWLLNREGKAIQPDGSLVPVSRGDQNLPIFWTKEYDEDGTYLYRNVLTDEVSLDEPALPALGGILAEEPGLGKTVEMIALMLLNPAPTRNPSVMRWDPEAKVDVKEVKTTLIVTPTTLAPQWQDEIEKHAPGLRVFIYEGWNKLKVPITIKAAQKINGKKKATDTDSKNDEILDWCNFINQYDVCITTYNVLQADLAVALTPVTRPRREFVSYATEIEKPRSPLIMCEWYRVMMDEVQMVGGGKVEEMVSLIPRLSSFAVSGTPARAQIADLCHVMKFLRVEGAEEAKHWKKLLLPEHVDLFANLFRTYAIRTLKNDVKDELTIPAQTRYLVPIQMGRVERQVYEQELEKALDELGLDANGIAAAEGWVVDTTVLRSWVRKLRGITTHPQVGTLNDRAERLLSKAGGLKSITEVLDDMRLTNHRTILDGRRQRVELLIREARLGQQSRSPNRYQEARALLIAGNDHIQALIQDLRDELVAHDQKGEEMKQGRTEVRDEAEGSGSGKQRDESPRDDDDEYSTGIPKTPAGAAWIQARKALVGRLREAQLVHHKVQFFLGDVYHILAPDSLEERQAYQAAENMRNRLLATPEQSAIKLMNALDTEHSTGRDKITIDTSEVTTPFSEERIKQSEDLIREVEDTIDGVLHEQVDLLWSWRSQLVTELKSRLRAGADDNDATQDGAAADGDEYSRTINSQARAGVLLDAITALLSDRREVVTGMRSALSGHDILQPTKKGRKKNKAQQEKDLMRDEQPETKLGDDMEARPEDEVLRAELKFARDQAWAMFRAEDEEEALTKTPEESRSLRKLLFELSAVNTKIDAERRKNDKEHVQEEIKHLRKLITQQTSILEKLDNDVAFLRRTLNERIEYFRQLQDISDSVAEVEFEGTLDDAIESATGERMTLEAKIAAGVARARYLDNMASDKQDAAGDEDKEDKDCIICREAFHRGFITACAHVLCENCMKAWLNRGTGRKVCPICRNPLAPEQLRRFTLGNAPPRAVNTPAAGTSATPATHGDLVPVRSSRVIEYNVLPSDLMEKIQEVEILGSYGSKVETIIRHLLYVQISEPGSKSIIFSAWPDALAILQHALGRNHIPCLRIDQSNSKKSSIAQRFQNDPDMQVLLLHGGRDNAGLNVTCASRVFLVESVVNHAFELQAIARVDRMGQTKSTEVFCYFAEDTLERNIVDLAARQGLSLYTKENCTGTISVQPFADSTVPTSPSNAKAKKSQIKGDYIMSTDDMLAILFPMMYEEVQYLIPGEEDSQADSSRMAIVEEPPIAGPSRLPA